MPGTPRSAAIWAWPIVTNGRNCSMRIEAARLSASSGPIVPSVSISIVSLSKFVTWPTRVLSTQ